MRGFRSVLVVAVVLTAVSASAAPQRLAQNWHEYSPSERYKALRNYRSYEALPNDRREKVERNYQRWQAMPEPERERMRKNYQRYQQLRPEQRNRLKQRYLDQPKR